MWRRAPWRRLAVALLAAAVVVGTTGGCRHRELIIKTADGRKLRADDIDQDPLALLPGGAIGIVYLDAQALYASPFGQGVLALAQRHAPVPAAANYDPKRDLVKAYVGFYSMQGADFAGVATGTFDQAAIERAADGTQVTPLGVPVVQSTYANRKLYTAANLGFVVLTAHTVLFGNETGIRRTLDRIDRGVVKREVPRWALDLLERPEAPLAAAFDLETNPISAAAREQLPFAGGLQRVRMVGNFQPPGINVAGTSTYEDAPKAQQGAAQMNELEQTIRQWGWAAALMGMQQPVRQLSAHPNGAEVDFVIGLDAAAVTGMLDQASRVVAPALGGAQ